MFKKKVKEAEQGSLKRFNKLFNDDDEFIDSDNE